MTYILSGESDNFRFFSLSNPHREAVNMRGHFTAPRDKTKQQKLRELFYLTIIWQTCNTEIWFLSATAELATMTIKCTTSIEEKREQ